jgi:hypothetical protein
VVRNETARPLLKFGPYLPSIYQLEIIIYCIRQTMALFSRPLKTAEVLFACRRVDSSTMNLRFDKNYDRILGDWAKRGSGWGIAEKNKARRYSDIRLAR